MSQIGYANPQAAKPGLGGVGGAAADFEEPAGFSAQQIAAVPLLICVLVQLVYFVAYWLPETSGVPAHEWWLTQLSPMATAALTSNGQPQVAIQGAESGIPGALLLVCSVVLLWLSRTCYWLGQTAMLVPAGVGLLTCLVTWLALLVAGSFVTVGAGVALMLVWAIVAGYATYRCYLADSPGQVRKTWRSGLPLLFGYVLVGPLPTAVGRALFAPDLRAAAYGLRDNTVALRLAALWTPSTLLLYLCGVLVGVSVWLGYQCWPPRPKLRYLGRVVALAAAILATGLLGWPATTLAERRVTTLSYASPVHAVHFTCGSFVLDRPAGGTPEPAPAQTVVVHGLRCREVTTFSGYRQQATYTLSGSASPVKASTPDGAVISGHVVAAPYGNVLVIAQSSKVAGRANQLTGLRVDTTAQLWHYDCAGRAPLAVRFAAVPAGDRPELGRLTKAERVPTVVVRCAGRDLRFDPAVGPPR